MRVVIVGAGAVGSYLAERLSLEGQDVVVIESDSRRAAERAQRAGVDCTLAVHDDMIHAWTMFVGLLPEARPAFDELVAFARGALDG